MSQKIKVTPEYLTQGMYVAELDRPWLDSPFLFQGFLINSDSLLEEVNAVCDFVYIDIELSDPAICNQLQVLASRPAPITKEVTLKTLPHNPDEKDHKNYIKKLRQSRITFDNATQYIHQALDDARLGTSVNTKKAKQLVSELADQILTNQHALVWLTFLKNRDEYTANHCVNVCILALSFGRCLGLDKQQLNQVGLGGLLHDLGKMQIPAEILNKPGKLTPEEFEIIKQHPELGFKLLKDEKELSIEVLDAVLHHHERKKAHGYPDQLTEEKIPLLTQIISIVDVYDAVTSNRCYHNGISPYEALNKIYKWAEKDFNKELVESLIKCLGIYPIGSVVELSNGMVGVVISASKSARLRPMIMLVLDKNKQYFKKRKILNLANPRWRQGTRAIEIDQILNPSRYDINIKQIIEEESRTL
ncbi:Metal-dependent phosphohydrolase [hydrothermal vent metagenome]|uniref:Metal-dependent phosphohydrolase n=1 Tax=hydrothermal vent metagenome TaxID=652676 RepID=A0A3B1AG14_9ZZZZ